MTTWGPETVRDVRRRSAEKGIILGFLAKHGVYPVVFVYLSLP